MEEQGGNYLYILFILIGVSVLSIGIFYYLTDGGFELKGVGGDDDKPVEEKKGTVVKTDDIVNLENDGNLSIELKGNKITLSTSIVSGNKVLEVNGNRISYLGENGTFAVYKLYNDYLLIKGNDNSQELSHYYIINSSGKLVKDINTFTNGTQPSLFENDVLKSSKFIDKTIINYNSKNVNICSADEINGTDVPMDTILQAEYKLLYYGDDKFDLELVEGSEKSLVELQSSICN